MKGKFKLLMIFLFLFLLFAVNAYAETTFFDQDDAFIMGNIPVTGGITGAATTGGTTGGGNCTYEWNCTDWSECYPSGIQIRNCTNVDTCPDAYEPPETNQNCIYSSPKTATEKDEKILEVIWKEIANKNKMPIYSIAILIVLSFIVLLKKNYFLKLLNPQNKNRTTNKNKSVSS